MKEKIIKLLLSGGTDAAIANELILSSGLDVVPEEWDKIEMRNYSQSYVSYRNKQGDILVQNRRSKMWFKLYSTAQI